MHVPDNYDQFKKWDAEQSDWLERRPECADCGKHIQDDTAFCIDGEWICEGCMSAYLVNVEDYSV